MDRIGRRGFLGGVAAFAAAGCVSPSALPVSGASSGKTWEGWIKGHFQIHFIYTGVAESMFLIFPDGTSMLLDCGDFGAIERGDLALPVMPDGSLHAPEWIARYVKRVNPHGTDVDYMLISHFHRDHMGTVKWAKDIVRRGNRDYFLTGFGLAAETLHFRRAIDRTGGRYDQEELFEPTENDMPYLLSTTYGYLKARDGLAVEKLRLGATDQVVQLHGGMPGFSVKNICANGRFFCADGSIYDSLRPDDRMPWYWNENHLSCGHIFSYGKFRFFSAGDISGHAMNADGVVHFPEEQLVRTLTGPVSVAKVNHHGFKSMPDVLLRALRAKVYPACTWDVLHLTDDCLARFADSRNCGLGTLLLPGCFSESRNNYMNSFGRRYFHPAVYHGIHSIVDVPPGGETFKVTVLSARDEEMRVMDERDFVS